MISVDIAAQNTFKKVPTGILGGLYNHQTPRTYEPLFFSQPVVPLKQLPEYAEDRPTPTDQLRSC